MSSVLRLCLFVCHHQKLCSRWTAVSEQGLGQCMGTQVSAMCPGWLLLILSERLEVSSSLGWEHWSLSAAVSVALTHGNKEAASRNSKERKGVHNEVIVGWE